MGSEITPCDASILLRLWSTACALGLPLHASISSLVPCPSSLDIEPRAKVPFDLLQKNTKAPEAVHQQEMVPVCYWFPLLPQIKLKPYMHRDSLQSPQGAQHMLTNALHP